MNSERNMPMALDLCVVGILASTICGFYIADISLKYGEIEGGSGVVLAIMAAGTFVVGMMMGAGLLVLSEVSYRLAGYHQGMSRDDVSTVLLAVMASSMTASVLVFGNCSWQELALLEGSVFLMGVMVKSAGRLVCGEFPAIEDEHEEPATEEDELENSDGFSEKEASWFIPSEDEDPDNPQSAPEE